MEVKKSSPAAPSGRAAATPLKTCFKTRNAGEIISEEFLVSWLPYNLKFDIIISNLTSNAVSEAMTPDKIPDTCPERGRLTAVLNIKNPHPRISDLPFSPFNISNDVT